MNYMSRPVAGGEVNELYFPQLIRIAICALNLKEGKGRDALDNALRKHVLAKVEYRLQYGRR
jgi:hypothetical protein